ncbi:MAG: InlB B-repeat-containing protein [Ilumatobacteraceae bacterium]
MNRETQQARASKPRRALAMLSAVVLAGFVTVVVAAPAHAAPVSSIGGITAALTGCAGTTATPTEITLAADVSATTSVLTIGCVVDLDLAGFTLSVRSVSISSGQQLTIDDSATGGRLTAITTVAGEAAIETTNATLVVDGGIITATGSGAGIGGKSGPTATGLGYDGGTVIINDGQVTATGGANGSAGIGGGGVLFTGNISGNGGHVEIHGGTVVATGAGGGGGGAGIGGAMLGSGGTVLITGGTVTALAGSAANGAAGIGGGGSGGVGGTVTITGGTVTATGSGTAQGGAGIGGGNSAAARADNTNRGSGGTVTISGGTVVATGIRGGSGIGAGRRGVTGGTVTITGGTVTAVGSSVGGNAAGIGGGYGAISDYPNTGSGATVSIGAGADVTATGGFTAVGSGEPAAAHTSPALVSFGSLEVDGILRIPSGSLRIQDSNTAGAEVVVGSTGQILGSVADPTTGSTIEGTTFAGTGQIQNDGVIAHQAALVTGVKVYSHNYVVTFDAQGGTPATSEETVFAPSFDTGYRAFPASDPTRSPDVFKGWNTAADGSGSTVTSASILPGFSADGAAVPVTYYAMWATLEIVTGLTGDEFQITTITGGSFTPTVLDSDGDPFVTDPSTWSITDAGGAVVPVIDPVTGEITVTGTTPGTYTVTLTIPAAGGTITRDITVVVALPTFTTGPTASFTGELRVGETLTADAGNPSPTPDSIVFTWFADGVAIGTGSTYVLTSAEVGRWISVEAVAIRDGYTDAADTSDEQGPVAERPEAPDELPESPGAPDELPGAPDEVPESPGAPEEIPVPGGELPSTGSEAPLVVAGAGGVLALLGVALILGARRRHG